MGKVDRRLEKILELLDIYGYMTVERIAELTECSPMSVRRHLRLLTDAKQIKRFNGGAISLKYTNEMGAAGTLGYSSGAYGGVTSPQIAARATYNPGFRSLENYFGRGWNSGIPSEQPTVKQRIAQAAVQLINDGARIIVDSGSTTGEMVHFLEDKLRLTVLTSSLTFASKLARYVHSNRHKLMLTGGTYDVENDTFFGTTFGQVLKDYSFEKLFVGADGFDFEKGTMSVNEGGNYSEILSQISDEVIVLIESNKIGRKMPKLELSWDKISTVITDDGIKDSDLQAIKSKGIKVIVV